MRFTISATGGFLVFQVSAAFWPVSDGTAVDIDDGRVVAYMGTFLSDYRTKLLLQKRTSGVYFTHMRKGRGINQTSNNRFFPSSLTLVT
jgi:hypothetical protein